MSRGRRKRKDEKKCRNKKAYPTQASAHAAKIAMNKKGKLYQRYYYHCPHCKQYHLSTSRILNTNYQR